MYSGCLQKLNGDHAIMAQLMETLRGFVKFYEIDQYLCEVSLLMEWPLFRVLGLINNNINLKFHSNLSLESVRAQTGNHDSLMNKCKSCFMKKGKNFPTIMFHENGGGNL